MVRKINKNNSYCSILSILKVASLHNIRELEISITPKVLPILKILWNLNFILDFYFLSADKVKITLERDIFKHRFKNLRVFYRSGCYYYISYRKLRRYFSSNYTNIMILSTSSGIITHIDALKLRLGGKIIFVLY